MHNVTENDGLGVWGCVPSRVQAKSKNIAENTQGGLEQN